MTKQFTDRHVDPLSDQRPWLAVAELVLAGKFGVMDDSLRQSLWIGLRGIDHDRCRLAAEKVKK